jgi:hypothetical protein
MISVSRFVNQRHLLFFVALASVTHASGTMALSPSPPSPTATDCALALPAPDPACFFCSKDDNGEDRDISKEPYAQINGRHGETFGETFNACSKCRPNIMKIFNSGKLRDGRRLPIAIIDPALRAQCCIHCGIWKPCDFVACRSALFRVSDEICILCKKCYDGVYTQLAIPRQKDLFEHVHDREN